MRNTDNPLVSLLCPAYRCERFLDDMVWSVLRQTYVNWELCMVDDGSDDDQWSKMSRWSSVDPRIRAEQIPHSGYALAYNHSMGMAKGDLFARQDADDTVHPDRLLKQVKLIIEDRADICTCVLQRVRESGERMHERTTGMDPWRYITRRYPTGPGSGTIMAWRDVYDRVGGFDPKYEWSADSDWNFRALVCDNPPLRWTHCPDVLYYYRDHQGQMMKVGREASMAAHWDRQRHYYPEIRNRIRREQRHH